MPRDGQQHNAIAMANCPQHTGRNQKTRF